MSSNIDSTPINHRFSTIHEYSLLGREGKYKLPQYRLKIADDMSRESVLFTAKEFCDILLPDPSDPRFADAPPRPTVGKNPFAALRDTKNMSEMDISILLVSSLSFATRAPSHHRYM